VERWRDEAEPLLAEQERSATRRQALDQLAEVAAAAAAAPGAWPEPHLLSAAGRFLLDLRLAVGPQAPAAADLPATVLCRVLPLDPARRTLATLVVGARADRAAVDAALDAHQARLLPWPADLDGDWPQAVATLAAQQAEAGRDARRQAEVLQALADRHRVAEALATLERVAWLVHHGQALAASERLVWVTGWTTAADPEALCAPLQRAGLHGVAQFTAPPSGAEVPSRLANPPWARAFEAFARLLGQPGPDEADPSRLLAFIAPLLFGFMFGDVGQGAVLLVAGLLLRRRWPALVMLVPGGLAAMGFGWAFGSVFAREDVIPPLWGHPLAHPVELLAAAIALGALILGAGLALHAVGAAWRRDLRGWWARDAALVLAYGGALAAPWAPQALAAVAGGALWMALGTAAAAPGARLAGAARGLAQFVEQALQLAVNTVSFARVGAFALAHAGLSAAVTGIADAAGPVGQWLVLVAGNLLILVLEGLVVGIQTTRLLLFEFFLRFLTGRGRAFRPLPPPPTPAQPITP
jgi:V/A-type H+-transporting ATPase subunit I